MKNTKISKKVDNSETKEKAPLTKTPMNLLFQAISYEDDESLENFYKKMDITQAIFILMSAATYAQSKGGVYNLNEAEAISVAIRTLKKKSKENSKNSEKNDEVQS